VAAVFAHGPEWQFKGWKWGSPDRPADLSPPDIFERALGFHLCYEGDILHDNIPKWNVTPLTVSKTRRYLDPGVAQKFWASLDTYITVHKPFLLPRARQGGGGGGASSSTAGGGGR
jgi:parafibromin